MFGKNSVRSGLAFLWSAFAISYLVLITVRPIPESNHRIVDTVLGFLLGTIVSGIIGYYFGSSQSSADKTELLSKESNPDNTTTVKASITTSKSYKDLISLDEFNSLSEQEKLFYTEDGNNGYRKI